MTVYNITVTYFSNAKQKFVKRDFLVREESEEAACAKVFGWFVRVLGFPIQIKEMIITPAA